MVWSLQAVGAHLGRARREVQGQPRRRRRQDGLDCQRAAGCQNLELSDDQVLSEGQRPGPSVV